MKIKIKQIIEDGMITHLIEGETAEQLYATEDDVIKVDCELFFTFVDENGNEWGLPNDEKFHSFYVKKK